MKEEVKMRRQELIEHVSDADETLGDLFLGNFFKSLNYIQL